jgi:tripartite-type tricarboxylate transporter receptor subunit TctC
MPRSLVVAACLAVAAIGCAHAQQYPSKPVTVMMPYSPGGPGDTLTRIMTAGLSKHFNQQFVVENLAGAAGTIGTAKVAASPPDGYTLLVMHLGQATNSALYKNLRYDPVKNFAMLGLMGDSPMAFVARKGFPAKDFKEFVAYVRANAGKLTYGHAGVGSASHLCGLAFLGALDVKVTLVPYKGTGPALNDLLGGHFDFMCDQTLNVLPHIRAGAIQAYAVTPKQRLAVLPDLPTANEGGLPGFETNIWYGMYGVAGTPEPVLERLRAGISATLDDPEVRGRLEGLGFVIAPKERRHHELHRKHVEEQVIYWRDLLGKAGVVAQ